MSEAQSAMLDRKIWGIAWPAILSNISVPLLGLVDSAVLGHLGSSRYLAAVAVGSALMAFLYWGFSFLRMGTTGLVARAEGAGNRAAATLVLLRSGVLALAIAAMVLLLSRPLIDLGLLLMSPAADLQPLAASYARIRIYSAPAVLATYTIIGWFIGRQNTRWPMLVVLVTNLANIGLDFLLVIGLDMRSDGAALATVIAEYLGLVIAIACAARQLPRAELAAARRQLLVLVGYTELLRSNRHLFVRTVCLLFGFAFFTAQGENLGSEVVAANTLLLHLLMLAAYGMDGFAFAAEALSGHYLGAGDGETFFRAVRRCSLWAAVSVIAVSLALLAGEHALIAVLTDLDSIRGLLARYFPWLVILPLVAAPAYLLDGIFIGASETRLMMLTMLVSLIGVYLPLWYATLSWGNHGLWLAFTAFNLARGITLYICYRGLSHKNAWQGLKSA